MNYYLVIFLSIIIILFNASVHSKKKVKENFESYENCVRQGYPNSFCMQTPIISKVDYGYCKCANGEFGSYHVGDGKCYCSLYGPRPPYYTNHVFHDFV